MSGTTNITEHPSSGALDARRHAPRARIRSASRRARRSNAAERGRAPRARGQRPRGARAGASAAALPRRARHRLDQLPGALEGGSRAGGHCEADRGQGRLLQASAGHGEVKRLSWIERKAAAILFGGGFLSKGNWDDAQRYLEKAVALKPRNIFHRLELGEVYVDLGKYSKAREQFTALATLPIGDVLDPEYKKEARQVLEDIKGEKDES